MIRWLLLAAQAETETTIRFHGEPGEDVHSMARCLTQMGVKITKSADKWKIQGVGANGFRRPVSVLNCGNSGTALRLLTIAAARLDCPIMLDGDRTLRRRHSETLLHILEYLGVRVSHGTGLESLPYYVCGPMGTGEVTLEVSKSSQPLSALLLSMPALSGAIRVNLSGDGVSRRHAQLSFDLAGKCGSPNEMDWRPYITLTPWVVDCPGEVEIPSDRSLEAFALLFAAVHRVAVDVVNLPSDADSLGAEILATISQRGDSNGDAEGVGGERGGGDSNGDTGGVSCERGGGDSNADAEGVGGEQGGGQTASRREVDLRDANDLISPLAAILALGDGGRITGASHARLKESNRIEKTVALLASFGIEAVATDDGLEVAGGQQISAPDGIVETEGDHRLWMTAACLASKVGATLSHPKCYRVSDPEFLSKLNSLQS